MDIFEFELRYLAYKGLGSRYELGFDESMLLNLVKRSNLGQLQKDLTKTSPTELKELTLETYTDFKREYIKNSQEQKIWTFTLAEYVERLEYEMKVVKEMWYNTYFLIVQDYINRSRQNNISVGPWRWSAAWSLMAYLVWITDIDPLQYDLLFERFLNPARISMPDIDTDFEDIQRDKLIEYVKQKYWNDKVALIGTYMTMAAKAAFKDVARVMWMPFEQSNKISNLISEKNIQESLEKIAEFKDLYDTDSGIQKIIDIAMRLEGTIRQTWVHACGIIISPQVVTQFTPIQYPPRWGGKGDKDSSRIVTQYDWHYLEDIGLLKMDFLWLRNLTIIKNTIKAISKIHEAQWKKLPKMFQIYLDTMGFYPPMNDQYTFEQTFQKWNTSWVFQFESDWMKSWLKKLKPNNIDDIIAMVSLYRPWPMDFIPNYVDRKHWKEALFYLFDEEYNQLVEKYWEEAANEEKRKITEDLAPFMDTTYWIPIYQEQLMRIVQAMAWFSLWEADLLRRWVWKKIKEIIDKLKKEFVERAAEYKWYKEITTTYVYEKMIEPAARYSFNKSHAACYAYISYQTAYLKAHYPVEFHAALLRSVEDESDKFEKFVNEIKIQWFKVLWPDVNASLKHVAAIDGNIRVWFLAIKWVWYDVWDIIAKERKVNGKFKDFQDFLSRCKLAINKKSLESLAKAWALDELKDRNVILANMERILEWIKNKSNPVQSMGLFDMTPSLNILELQEVPHVSLMEKIKFEYEVFGTFISLHPFDGMYDYLRKKYNFATMFTEVENYGDFNMIGFVKSIRRVPGKWFFVTLEDISGQVNIFIKDVLDISEFDILSIKWYKWKSIRIRQACKIDLDELISKAQKSGQYNPELSVAEARAKRITKEEKIADSWQATDDSEQDAGSYVIPSVVEGSNDNSSSVRVSNGNAEDHSNDHRPPQDDPDYIEEESEDSATNAYEKVDVAVIEAIDLYSEQNSIDNEMPNENQSTQAVQRIRTFTLPDNIQVIKHIKQIIKENPWEIEIDINGHKITINQKAYDELKKIL